MLYLYCVVYFLYRRSRFAAGPVTQFNPYPIQQQSSSGLDDFDDGGGDGGSAHKSVDFAQKVRTTIMLDFQDLARGEDGNKELIGLEVCRPLDQCTMHYN